MLGMRAGAPGFWRSLVLVVDGGQVVVLNMPGECCVRHANVEKGSAHAWDISPQPLQGGPRPLRQDLQLVQTLRLEGVNQNAEIE